MRQSSRVRAELPSRRVAEYVAAVAASPAAPAAAAAWQQRDVRRGECLADLRRRPGRRVRRRCRRLLWRMLAGAAGAAAAAAAATRMGSFRP